MGFFGGSSKSADADRATASSTATWQSIASGDSAALSHSDENGGGDDGSGFLHPESSLASNRALQSTAWSKERTSQQLELEDAHRWTRAGCCTKAVEVLVKALHVVDISIGMAMIVYGSLIYARFDEPAMAAVLFCLILGCVHLSTSSLGVFSLLTRGCSRIGLLVSAYVGPYVAFVYFTMLISLLVDSSGFLKYLDDHKEAMYLGPNVAENCRRLMPLFYTILIVLGLLEASRFCVLVKLRDRLLQNEVAEAYVPRSSHGEPVSANKTLTEALLQDDIEAERIEAGGGGGAVGGKETAETPNWWEK